MGDGGGGGGGGGNSSAGRSVKHEETRGKFRTTRFLAIFFSFPFSRENRFRFESSIFPAPETTKRNCFVAVVACPKPWKLAQTSHEFMGTHFKK